MGSSFEAKIAQDVSVKGSVVLKAGTKAFGKFALLVVIRASPSRLSVELDVRSSEWTQGPGKDEQRGTSTAHRKQRARRVYGHTAGTTVVNPKTLLQFQLLQPVTL